MKKKLKTGDLIKISSNFASSIALWYKTQDDDVRCFIVPQKLIMAMYIGIWVDSQRNMLNHWHEIYYDNQILIVHTEQIRKIKK